MEEKEKRELKGIVTDIIFEELEKEILNRMKIITLFIQKIF